jgi:hypothetical protein
MRALNATMARSLDYHRRGKVVDISIATRPAVPAAPPPYRGEETFSVRLSGNRNSGFLPSFSAHALSVSRSMRVWGVTEESLAARISIILRSDFSFYTTGDHKLPMSNFSPRAPPHWQPRLGVEPKGGRLIKLEFTAIVPFPEIRPLLNRHA